MGCWVCKLVPILNSGAIANLATCINLFRFYLFLFCLETKKKEKNSRQSPIPPGVFAFPRLPRV